MDRARRIRQRFLSSGVALLGLIAPAPALANPFGAPGTLADGEGGAGGLGQSMSMSADGTVAVVGEPNDSGDVGAALVYANADGTWSFIQKLTATGETGAGHFGAAVSMDPGGQALVVGAPDDGGVGKAYVFALNQGLWTQQGVLDDRPFPAAGRGLGASVAIANGGTIALVGAPGDNNGTGQAYTYNYTGYPAEWSYYQPMHTQTVAAGAHFGTSVAMSSNGSSAVVGAPDAKTGAAVYTFGHNWESAYWIDHDPISSGAAGFGTSVALVQASGAVIIGAPLAGGGQGAVYEYRTDGMQIANFTDPNPSANGHFGASVAVAGNTMDELIVGAPGVNGGAGAAYDFDATHGADWTTDGVALTPVSGPAGRDRYGTAVAVAANGSHALVGAPGASAGDGLATHFISADLTVPEPPYVVQAYPGDGQADVTWTEAQSTGGSPISSYTATSSPDALTCTAPSGYTCTVHGLTNGRKYTFTVTATNHIGTSAPSSPSGEIIPIAPPINGGGGGGSPGDGGGSTTGGGGSTGGGSTTGSGGSGGVVTTGGSGGGGSLPGGLTSGGGGGVRRDTTAPTRPSGTLKVVSRRRTSIAIGWGAASDDTAVVGYRVYEYVAGKYALIGTTAATKRTFVRTGLRRRTRHRFCVRAYDAAGNVSAPLVSSWAATR